MSEMLSVEVCYALPDQQTRIMVTLPRGATLQQALVRSAILQRHPEIDLERQKVGVFGKLKPLDTLLADHDRVEIYRPLTADPKTARARRVNKSRKAGSTEGHRWRPRDPSQEGGGG
ncbi:RnfH family protein [Paraburkholderia bonniea]|uniref:RnfH family protein n=1 Tax=Paraburkholderia bonniea TaxID=2152891 RepID=UPI001291E75A|nr:RnfH family protein [Paraburkholderia bonniea]WJF89193.1 RnfH family protein [Paraburkholderia bonniea]WJF92509.1 RnfH family protein [Paraburkholderia bonniea]